MEAPKHWRLRKQRYALVGELCPRCDAKIFPPRDVCPYCGGEVIPEKINEAPMVRVSFLEERAKKLGLNK